MTKSSLLLTSAIATLSSLVLAAAAAAAAAAAPTTAAPASSSASATEVGAVIVTAEKRSQNLQKVPVAVTAFTSKQRDLTGIENVEDMANVTPGLIYSTSSDRLTLRGVSRQSNTLSADGGAAIFVDGLFTTSTVEVSKPPLMVGNVEVLRGPQGTLQGRNSVAGDLLVTSARPTNAPYAEGRLIIGNYGKVDTQLAVSGPLADGLNFRIDMWDTQQSQGYFKDVANGSSEGANSNQYYIQPSLTAKLGENADLYVKAFVAARNDDYGPGSRTGYSDPVFSGALNDKSSPLFFNAAAGYAGGVGYNPANIVPGSFQQTNNNITSDPALSNIRDFSANTKGSTTLKDTYDFDTIYTYHMPTFDIKYTGGFQEYHYHLQTDDDGTDVLSYQIPCAPGAATCAAAGALTVYPQLVEQYEEDSQWYSHEITLASTTHSALQWVAGAYFFDTHFNQPIAINAPAQAQVADPYYLLANYSSVAAAANPGRALYYTDGNMETRTEAVYGQVDYKITETIKLTGGLRYTDDHKDGTEAGRTILFGGNSSIYGLSGGLSGLYGPGTLGNATRAFDFTSCPTVRAQGAGACTINAEGDATRTLQGDWSATTGTAGVEWTPTSDTLGYLRYSRGYKAGAINAGALSALPDTAPEYVNAYEVGLKKSFGRNLVVDADVFYYDYTDAQYSVTVTNAAGVNQGLLTGIPKSRIDGFELETIWTPLDHLQFNLSYAFNDTAITTGCNAATHYGCYVDSENPSGSTTAVSVKGDELPNAPRNKVSLTGDYTWVFDSGTLTASGTYDWRDRQFGAIFNEPYYVAPSYSQVDLRATWKGRNDKYELIAFGRNVFNTVGYETGGSAGLIGAVAPYGQYRSFALTPPATYGLEVHYKFF